MSDKQNDIMNKASQAISNKKERYKQKLEKLKATLKNENDQNLIQDLIDKVYNNDPSVANKNNNDNISKIYNNIINISKYISNYENFAHYSSISFEDFEKSVNSGEILHYDKDLRTEWNTFSQEDKKDLYTEFINQSKDKLESIKTINSNANNIEELKKLVNEITKLKTNECKIYQKFCDEMITEINNTKKEYLITGGDFNFFSFLMKSFKTQESIQLDYYEKIKNKIKESIETKKSFWEKIFNR